MNKKGLTLIEIIVSIALISIVMVFLFQIVITIKNANDRQNNSSNNKMSVLIITREVQKDLDSFGLENTPIANCDFDDNSNNIVPATASKVNCVKILYDSNNAKNNEGYILYYENNNKYFLAYKRGKGNVIETQTVREISVPPKENLDIKINRAGNDNDFSIKINVPIRDDSENYDLDINYIYTKAVKYQVKIISENGLALNIKGNGKYYPNDIVNISFDYDSVVNQLESVECINDLCQNNNNFSFTMPNEDVVIIIKIKADIVAPTCTTNVTGGDYANGWTVLVTCSDVGSGCVMPSQTYVGIKQNRTFTVYDKAGNSGICTSNVPIDNVKPTCTTNVTGGDYTNGWTVEVTCSDVGSGCVMPSQTYVGIKQNRTFTVYDKAGNSGICTSNVPIDNVKPTCSLDLNDTNIVATYNDDHGVAYFGWDSSYSGSNSQIKAISAGTHTFYVKDIAGNTNTCKIDVKVITKKTEKITQTKAATPQYGTRYTGSCSCVVKTIDHPNGRRVNGTCNYTSGCSCPGTNWINKCVKRSVIIGYKCDDWWDLSGSTCSHTYNIDKYSCDSGYTNYNNLWCYKKD